MTAPDLTPFLAALARLQTAPGEGRVTFYLDADRQPSGVATVYHLPCAAAEVAPRLAAIIAAVPAHQEVQITAEVRDGALAPSLAVRCYTPLTRRRAAP